MQASRFAVGILSGVLAFCGFTNAQQQVAQSSAIVPRLVNFPGKAKDVQGKAVAGVAGVTFSIYKEQEGGAPLWMETQNIHPDAKGDYTAQLGSTLPQGIPLDLFSSGEARWLGVRINGGEEQPRVLLLSVPYALKAADAETIGGLPPSAFLRATPANINSTSSTSSTLLAAVPAATPAVSGTGTTDFVPLWTNNTGALGNSALFQSGSGATAKIGIDTTAPATTLDVKGTSTLRGILTLPATAAATAAAGKSSNPINFAASAFNSSTAAAVNENFRWQAEAAANNTAIPSGTLNLLFGSGTTAPKETGLRIASNGVITFAAAQTFPGGGNGSVTSVGLSAPTTDFTVSGSPVTSAGTLALKWKVAPTNANTANAIVKRDATGSFTAGAITGTLGVAGLSAGASTGGVSGTNTASGYGVIGVASGTSGQGVWGESFGTQNSNNAGPDGVHGITHGSAGAGVAGLSDGTNGLGVYGQGLGTGVYGIAAGSGFLLGSGTGVSGNSALGTGVFGSGGGNAFVAQGHASQDRTSGGWVKAMVQWNGESGTAMRCYNSTLTGANATTPPCGFTVTSVSNGLLIDFGFEVDDRFYSATMARCLCGTKIAELFATPSNSNPNELTLGLYEAGTSNIITGDINLIVF